MSEARRFGRAVVVVRAVTVECPFCGASVDPDGVVSLASERQMHTDDRHVRAGERQCSNCWQRFEVPDLSLVFRRILPRRARG
jgi:hypothetical protein